MKPIPVSDLLCRECLLYEGQQTVRMERRGWRSTQSERSLPSDTNTVQQKLYLSVRGRTEAKIASPD